MEIITNEEVLIVDKDPDHSLVEVKVIDPVLVEEDRTVVVTTDDKETIYIGSKGPQGPGGVIGELQYNTLVQPNETRTLDSVNIALVDSVIWEVTVVDRILNRKRVTAVRAVETEGNTSFIVGPYYGTAKTLMLHEYNVTLVSGELTLSLTNNHNNDLTCEVLRIKTNRIDF